MHYLHLCAPNDHNGNPRRLYMVLRADGTIVACIDEGYRGISALRIPYGSIPGGLVINIAPAEYRRLRTR